MKKLFLTMILTVSASVFAQTTMKEDIEIIQSVYGKDKKEFVAEYMKVPEAKAAAFWKVYDEYENERKVLGKTKMNLINNYAMNYESLSEEKADELAKGSLKNNMDYEKLMSKYYPKFKGVVGAAQAVKLMQLEIYLQTQIRAEIQNAVPFIGEMEKAKMNSN